jgi:hypothetical protein
MAETYLGKPCQICGGTERRVKSSKCKHSGRSDHTTVSYRQEQVNYQRNYRPMNREALRNKNSQRRRDNPQKARNYYNKWVNKNRVSHLSKRKELREKNAEFLRSYRAKRYVEKRDLIRAQSKAWVDKNKGKQSSMKANCRIARMFRVPRWANLTAIAEIYSARPDGYHVDHIVPLQGKTVCGLHVEHNLQYLSAVENIKKGNRFSVV